MTYPPKPPAPLEIETHHAIHAMADVFARKQRFSEPFALLMFDLDRFK